VGSPELALRTASTPDSRRSLCPRQMMRTLGLPRLWANTLSAPSH